MERIRQERTTFQPGGKFAILRTAYDYHHVGQGVSDYSERMNKAFKDLRKMKPLGGMAKLPAARYNISNLIVMPIFGMAQTRLFVNDRAPTFRLAGTIRSLHTRRVSVMDTTIDGNMSDLSRDMGDIVRCAASYYVRHCCRGQRAAITLLTWDTSHCTNLEMDWVFHGVHKLRLLE